MKPLLLPLSPDPDNFQIFPSAPPSPLHPPTNWLKPFHYFSFWSRWERKQAHTHEHGKIKFHKVQDCLCHFSSSQMKLTIMCKRTVFLTALLFTDKKTATFNKKYYYFLLHLLYSLAFLTNLWSRALVTMIPGTGVGSTAPVWGPLSMVSLGTRARTTSFGATASLKTHKARHLSSMPV